MTSTAPTSARLALPQWMWAGETSNFLASADLIATEESEHPGSYVVRAAERAKRGKDTSRFTLVRSFDLARAGADEWDMTLMAAAEAAVALTVGPRPGPDNQLKRELERLDRRASKAGRLGYIAPRLSLFVLQTLVAASADAPAVVGDIVSQLRSVSFSENDEHPFPSASAHMITRAPALIHRARIASVLLRIQNDPRLAAADIEHIRTLNEEGEIVFASSSGLGDGLFLMDGYISPLIGALSPDVWGIASFRAAGTVIYGLGAAIPGIAREPVEALQVMPTGMSGISTQAPELSADSAASAVQWWGRRLNNTLSAVTDPAVHSDSRGEYSPTSQLHGLASLEQLFRRVAAIQRGYRDPDARRVLLFTALDTLERLSDRTLREMCTLEIASRTLARLQTAMPGPEQAILLPAAERAVGALRSAQSGFFLAAQLGQSAITFTDRAGTARTLSKEAAVAEYIRLLRNATHGHGSNREDQQPMTNALLAHHDGTLDHDLPLLAYLYLLDLLTRPDVLRRRLWEHAAGQSHPTTS